MLFTSLRFTVTLLAAVILTNANSTTPTTTLQPIDHSRAGLAQDLKSAASEIENAASEIESWEDETEDEENYNPFEWRVQLIHKRLTDDDWARIKREKNFDQGEESVSRRKGGERYRKKKIDILIEEWWNNEKWNRQKWDKFNRTKQNYKTRGGAKHRRKDGKQKLSYGRRNKSRVYLRRRNGRKGHRKNNYGAESRQTNAMAKMDARPICARANNEFCEVDPDYPEAIVSQLINANVTRFRELINSAHALWDSRPVKEAISEEHSPECVGEIRETVPLWAPNNDGRWKIIANTQKFKQKYIVEICTEETLNCAIYNNLTCTEQFGRLPLVALDLTMNQQFHVDWFAMPFACNCRSF